MPETEAEDDAADDADEGGQGERAAFQATRHFLSRQFRHFLGSRTKIEKTIKTVFRSFFLLQRSFWQIFFLLLPFVQVLFFSRFGRFLNFT